MQMFMVQCRKESIVFFICVCVSYYSSGHICAIVSFSLCLSVLRSFVLFRFGFFSAFSVYSCCNFRHCFPHPTSSACASPHSRVEFVKGNEKAWTEGDRIFGWWSYHAAWTTLVTQNPISLPLSFSLCLSLCLTDFLAVCPNLYVL